MEDNSYIAVSEAARRLQVTPTTIYNWVKKGLVRAIRSRTGRWRVNGEDCVRVWGAPDAERTP